MARDHFLARYVRKPIFSDFFIGTLCDVEYECPPQALAAKPLLIHKIEYIYSEQTGYISMV